jgi:hypothetical protein
MGAWAADGTTAQVAVDGTTCTLTAGEESTRGELFVVDGDRNAPLDLMAAEGPVAVNLQVGAIGAWTRLDVRLTNRTDRQLKLEVGLRFTPPANATEFFDGERPVKVTVERISDRFNGRFPLTTMSSTTGCVAVGWDPTQWLSYLRHAHSPARGDWETATRIVLDPGQSETLRLLLAAFPTRWGYREALHWFYEAFPSLFLPLPDIDPRTNGNGGSYLAWHGNGDPEMCRRLCVGWEWCYAPFKRTGDIYGRPEFWDYEPARPFSADRKVSLEEYHRKRQERFALGKVCDVAMMCYIPAQIWCEERLARERYADALITDNRVTTYFDRPWVTGHDNELRVFPLHTSFGRQSLLDMAALVAENNIQGFAFDVANGGARYFGPAVNQCPGRAWDDRGVYVDEGVAIAKLMDWVHEHRDGAGRPLAVVSNPGALPCYLTPLRSDSAMLEADPGQVNSGMAQCLRHFLGHKTMVFWENYELEDLLRYETMTAEEMADALQGLDDYTVIACLRVAALPTPRVALGHPKLAQWMPLLAEVSQAGWQPIPAATCDAGLEVARAGQGFRQFLSAGNETAQDVAGTIQTEAKWLGGMLFAREGASSTTNRIVADGTAVDFRLPSRGALVLRSALQFAPAPVGATATVGVNRGLETMQVAVTLTGAEGGQAILRVPAWSGWVLRSVTIDGRAVSFREVASGWESVAALQLRPNSQLLLTFDSDVFSLPQDTLDAFPWVHLDEKACAFRICVPENADETTRYAAQRLADYFPYYYGHAAQPPVTLTPPQIVTQPWDGPCITVTVDPTLAQPARIAGNPHALTIAGRSGADVKRAVYALLAALDRKYPYSGRIPATPATVATKVAGEELPRP